MDEFIEMLYKKGYISLSSVGDYFENIKKTDEFISKMLLTAGVNRRPTPWDRENVENWKSWNFSEDMILEAAKLASGKTSPIPYMNGILGNWKNKGVFTADKVTESLTDTSVKTNALEDYNKEYERRRNVAISRAQKNIEKAMALEGFADIYSRLNSIEKDLAFAEINNDKDAYNTLEKEKSTIFDKGCALLKQIGLNFDDLEPKYLCDKCKDTGYVGTHKCDCWDKK